MKFDFGIARGILRKAAINQYGMVIFGTYRVHQKCVFLNFGQILYCYVDWT